MSGLGFFMEPATAMEILVFVVVVVAIIGLVIWKIKKNK